ncbi:UTP--glucose-1-phosphate uridylyltransferase [Nocardioides baekrokdamisoli]|uniref:UTP--glucose-1-phosphate uridylyltransferase n=1 Tax=Nocardioides baekrokdamisoli TaxID=1804624 RepID=A0A3G9ID66_9ACTN|nr:UTP--glucose-1-phosphate uridylyltransferase [Nocardioides baekrokdamisoli]BBH16897.1 UTP--glucose-1-phosphate uridylyltransferase [Nocardioides baekrokdamisoli]
MGNAGLDAAITAMQRAGVDETAILTFAHYYAQLENGVTGMIPEADIEPVDIHSLDDVVVRPADAAHAIRTTAVIKLNGGLGTSMGMDYAKSLLSVRSGLSFLDIAVRQVLHLRGIYHARLPLIFMNSFRTSRDTLDAIARYETLATPGLPLEFLQNKEPRLLVDDLTPVAWPQDPELEWCPPGHGDIYTSLHGTGLLDLLLEQGFERIFVSNSDNLGAVPDARIAGWFAHTGAPFAIEAVRRTASDRKGGHFTRRTSDDRIVLRESAQIQASDMSDANNVDKHRYMSTNNLWVDLEALRKALDERGGILGLPMIRNEKTVDPSDSSTPKVIQIETAMGAAIEVFDGAELIEVGRDRFVPVKTTNDLLVLRSDVYELNDEYVLNQIPEDVPFVDLDGDHYKLVGDFEKRFPDGVPSMEKAESLRVNGDITFGASVQVVGHSTVTTPGTARLNGGTVLNGDTHLG